MRRQRCRGACSVTSAEVTTEELDHEAVGAWVGEFAGVRSGAAAALVPFVVSETRSQLSHL